MLIKLLCLAWLTKNVLADGSPDGDCPPIVPCSNIERATDSGDVIGLTDTDIAEWGNMSGLKPESYQIYFHFQNEAVFSGSVNITALVVQETRRLVVHTSSHQLQYSLTNTVIYRNSVPLECESNCIEAVSYNYERRLLSLWTKTEIRKGTRITLTFKEFGGSTYDPYSGAGTKALRRAYTETFAATFTNFYPKHASSVFPCFDHPSLKARFQLRLRYPNDMMVACASSPTEKAPVRIDKEFLEQQFEYTPIIPIYTLSFAVMHNYEEYIHQNSNRTVILVPKEKRHLFDLFYWKVQAVVENAEKIFTTDVGFLPVRILIVYNYDGFSGMENSGLVPIDGPSAEDQHFYQECGGRFYRSIIHQWIGTQFTVSHFGEVCLQHGLAEYIEWMLWNKDLYSGRNLQETARKFSTHPSVLENRSMVNEASGYEHVFDPNCEHRAALVYHMVTQVFGIEAVERFAAFLAQTYRNRNLNMHQWDAHMRHHTDNETMLGFIVAWFRGFSPVTLTVSYEGNNVGIGQLPPSAGESFRPIPVVIQSSVSNEPIVAVMDTAVKWFHYNSKPDWVIVDPERGSLTRKVYDVSLYRQMLIFLTSSGRRNVNEMWRQDYLDSFCNLIFNDDHPLDAAWESVSWKIAFTVAASLDSSCRCCFVSPEKRANIQCTQWKSIRCSRISLLLTHNHDPMPEE